MKKYKLINRKTKEEHICNKVTVDGFDYFFIEINSDEESVSIGEEIVKLPVRNRITIATNNPSIDVPKVVDEIEELAKKTYRDNPNDIIGVDYKYNTDINAPRKRKAFKNGYNKAKENYKFTKEDVIEFAKWRFTYETNFPNNRTTQELLQLWQEQKTETIYFE